MNETYWKNEAERLKKETEFLQAKIDQLMLEYCPEDMTEQQLALWACHQKAVSLETHNQIEQAIKGLDWFSKDQNTRYTDGVWYTAQAAGELYCEGCAFLDAKAVICKVPKDSEILCSYCERKDSQDVIWVTKQSSN